MKHMTPEELNQYYPLTADDEYTLFGIAPTDCCVRVLVDIALDIKRRETNINKREETIKDLINDVDDLNYLRDMVDDSINDLRKQFANLSNKVDSISYRVDLD